MESSRNKFSFALILAAVGIVMLGSSRIFVSADSGENLRSFLSPLTISAIVILAVACILFVQLRPKNK